MSADPKIELGGQTFTIPTLVWKKSRVVLPAIAQLFRSFGPIVQMAMLAAAKNEAGDKGLDFSEIFGSLVLSDAQFDLIETILITSINGSMPAFNKEAFEVLPILPMELVAALPVVLKQTGVLRPAAADKMQAVVTKAMAGEAAGSGEEIAIGQTG